jgi:hypothetical protein
MSDGVIVPTRKLSYCKELEIIDYVSDQSSSHVMGKGLDKDFDQLPLMGIVYLSEVVDYPVYEGLWKLSDNQYSYLSHGTQASYSRSRQLGCGLHSLRLLFPLDDYVVRYQ